MADETCDVEVKTLPAKQDAVVKAVILTKNVFLATKELVLSASRNAEAVTNASGVATLTVLRDAKLLARTVDTESHFYNVQAEQLNVSNLRILIPNTATAKLADTVQ